MQTKTVYKIVSANDWHQACTSGSYAGSNDDQRDGFIHLSASSQIKGTLEKHFFQQPDLLLVSFSTQDLAPNLKWEPSRNGELFPHYFGSLPTQLAQHITSIVLDAGGQHQLPEQTE